MKYVTKLIIDNKEIDILNYRFGFKKRVDLQKKPNQLASFKGLEITVATTGDTFFEEWMLSEEAKPRIELHIYYPYLDEGSCKKMIFYDSYLIYHKTIFSSDNNQAMKEELKLTCAGIKTPNSEIEYETSWRKTFEKEKNNVSPIVTEKLPKITNHYIKDLEGNEIEKDEIDVGEEIVLIIESRNAIGETFEFDLDDDKLDYEHNGKKLKNDKLEVHITKDIEKIKLKAILQED